jgi:hypothetical protein
LKPGDVLFQKGEATGIWRIGATGGVMGHVVVVVSQPTRLARQSELHQALQEAHPSELPELWRISTVESTRRERGLHHTELFAYASPHAGHLVLVGELGRDGQISSFDREQMQVWQSPSEVRHRASPELVSEVLKDMEADARDWSYATAARAVLLPADSFRGGSSDEVFAEIKACWKAEPICTSVVISFWQRLLSLVARRDAHRSNSDDGDKDALDLILRWMPLKADRGLPGELLQCMDKCGWRKMKTVTEKKVSL